MQADNPVIKEIQKRYSVESKNSCDLSCGSNLQHLEITEGDTILDLGCGKGKETMQAAILAGTTGLAVGLDITDEMISEATKSADAAGISNIRFLAANIEEIPFAEGYFDKVLSNCVINHAKDKKKVYTEIYRVLKINGCFVISDAVTKIPLPEDIKNDADAWAQCFGGAVTEEEYLQDILQAGFEAPEILKRREYIKNGYDFISLTLKAYKL